MDLRQLDYLITAARLRSFTRAAEELFITRQALSRAVRNLEQEVGETLLVSRDGVLELTETGAALVAEAQPLVEAFEELSRRYGPMTAGGRPTLSIALVPGAALTLPVDFVESFSEAHPDVLLSVESSSTEGALDLVRSGESAIGLVGSSPRYLGEFDAQLLVETGTYVHVPISNPLVEKSQLTLEDLNSEPFLTFGKRDHLHRFLMDACTEAGVQPNLLMTSSNFDVLVARAHQENALMFGLPGGPIDADFPLIPIDLRQGEPFGTYAIKRKDTALSSSTRAFWEHLKTL